MKPVITGSEPLYEGKFLRLRKVFYTDDENRQRSWESAERTGDTGAAVILARLEPSGEILFVRQFRPPTGKYILEFPAGLIDPGENPAETAIRELFEETGYRGTVLQVSPPAYSSPGLTGEAIYLVTMQVDGSQTPTPAPDEGESIEVFQVHPSQLAGFLLDQEQQGVGVDSKIYTLLFGLFSH